MKLEARPTGSPVTSTFEKRFMISSHMTSQLHLRQAVADTAVYAVAEGRVLRGGCPGQ